MEKSQVSQFLGLVILIILFSSCRNNQDVQKDNESQVRTPLPTLQIAQSSAPAPTASATEQGSSTEPLVAEQSLSPLPTPTTTLLSETVPATVPSETPTTEVISEATVVEVETVTPATDSSGITTLSPTPAMAIPTNTPAPTFPANAQVTEANIITDASGETTISLPLTLNKNDLQPPVKEIIYLTSETNQDEDTVEATFWRADVRNITQATSFASAKNRSFGGVEDPIVSPDGRYLVYRVSDETTNDVTYLVELQSGQIQIFNQTVFSVAGWERN